MLTVDFDLLNIKPKDLALDCGCGMGRHSMEYMIRGARVFCLDMDLESLKKTKYELQSMIVQKQSHKDARFLAHFGDALKLPFKDNTFDSIICAEVMEHVPDDHLAARELTRVLKKNGRIAITVPTFFSELVYDIATYEYFTSPGGHVRKYLPKKLAAIMRESGLVIYDIDFRHAFHTPYWLIRCVVGLHLNDQPITKAYRTFLTMGLFSNFMRKLERFFDNFFPKSMILYAYKK